MNARGGNYPNERTIDEVDHSGTSQGRWIVYDALHAYCQEMIRRDLPNGLFA